MKWYNEKAFKHSRYGLCVDNFIHTEKSYFQTIDIFYNQLFGRVLALDGIYQTSTEDEYFYHEMLVHPALITGEKIERVLIIGGGDLGSSRRVLQYKEVKHVDLVEIDKKVITACAQHMPTIGMCASNDPRLEIFIEDGTTFVENQRNKAKYDIIIIDGSDPIGPAEVLIKNEFFQNCYNILSENGILVTQSGSPYSMTSSFYNIVRTLQSVFDITYPYFAPVPLYTNGSWSYTMALKGLDSHPLHTRISRLYEIEHICEYYNKDIHTSAFALPEKIKRDLLPDYL